MPASAIGARLPTLIEKSVELGAGELVPIVSQHCHARTLNEVRLQSIATEAAEQCGRLDVPPIRPITPLLQAPHGDTENTVGVLGQSKCTR